MDGDLPFNAVAAGANVTVYGLKDQNVYNGKQGVCTGVAKSGRYVIQLKDAKVLVKRRNLQVLLTSDAAYGPSYKLDRTSPDFYPSAWTGGQEPLVASEWLIDCYRLRLDDEFVHQNVCRGIYVDANSHEEIARDFLIFCGLTIFNGVSPDDWNWGLCLGKFGYLLNFKFGIDDAKAKYGSEERFSLYYTSRSLRITGEVVYGSSAVEPEHETVTDEVLETNQERARLEAEVKCIKWNKDEPFFADVGGFEVWNALLSTLSST